MCGALGTSRWTIDNGDKVVVADLCASDAQPLEAVMQAAGTRPPAKRAGDPERPAPRRQPKKREMEPLEWVPPTS